MQTFLYICLISLISLPFLLAFIGATRMDFNQFVKVFGYENKKTYLPATHKLVGMLTQIICPLTVLLIAQYLHFMTDTDISLGLALASPIIVLTINITLFTVCLWKVRPFSVYAIE